MGRNTVRAMPVRLIQKSGVFGRLRASVQAHCAEVAVFATGVEDVVRHVGVVAGRAVEIDGCVNGGFEYVFGAANF